MAGLKCASVAIVIAAGVLSSAAVWAADQFKEGDEVEVLFLNKWLPAKVAKTNQRGEVLAEFEFATRKQQQAFAAKDVRYAYEAGALAPPRGWSDADGKIHENAALVAIDADSITLRKPDKSEVTIPIAKLSEPDQEFIKKLQSEEGTTMARPPWPPKLETFEGTSHSISLSGPIGGDARQPLTPDPLPSYLKLKQGGVAFPIDETFDHLGVIVPVGGKDVLHMASIESRNPTAPVATRLLWASLVHQKVVSRQILPPGEVVLDYHSPSHRLLTLSLVKKDNSSARSTAALSLWEVLPTDAKVKPIVRWNAETDQASLSHTWGRIIDGELVLHYRDRQQFVGWDTAAKRVRYRFMQDSFFATPAALSWKRKQLFLPEDKGLRVIDTATGRAISFFPAKNGVTGVAVGAEGSKATVLTRGHKLNVWDLTDATAVPQVYSADSIANQFGTDLFSLDDQHMIEGEQHFGLTLFSLKHQISLWHYQFDSAIVAGAVGRPLYNVVDRHLIYGASLNEGLKTGLAVGAVLLPGPQVFEAEAAVDPEALLAVKPGTEIRLDVQAGEHNARVQAAMEAAIKKNGWTLSPTATTVLTAEISRGQSQTLKYQVFNRSRPAESVTVTAYGSSLRIKVGDKMAWQSGTTSPVPGTTFLKEGETAQAAADSFQKPNVEFFEQCEIPAKIIDPDKQQGLGVTKVTTRGLVVSSTEHK